MSETKILRCGIVGAGIGGLGAAIALQRAGHDVEVFERSAFKNEIGAAITLTPNASLILERWGFDAAKAGESNKCQYRSLRWDTLEVDYHDCFDGVQAKYGYMINAFHRVDLHNGLRDLAERHHSVSIRLGCEVYHVDCEAGIIGLTDGTHVQKDLIVVANGDKVSFAVHPLVLSSASSLSGSPQDSIRKGRCRGRCRVKEDGEICLPHPDTHGQDHVR